MVLKRLATCGLAVVLAAGTSSAAAAPDRGAAPVPAAFGAPSAASAAQVALSVPRPTGRHPVGVRSTFVHDRARTEPTTGGPRAIPTRVWYPARHRHGSSAPYFSAPVQPAIEQGIKAPTGLFDIDTHAAVDAPTRRRVRGVLLFTGGFSTPVALYTGLLTELASRGYAVVAFDHPHETFVVEQPDGAVIAMDLQDDAGPGKDCTSSPSACPVFEARMRDIAVLLGTLEDLVPTAGRRTPIGIFGHSNGGAAAGVAIRRHPQIRAGANLDGSIPPALITAGLDRPFGLMRGLDARPQELRDIETFLANMEAPYRSRSLDIRHFGFSDFAVFNPQARRADATLGRAFETMFPAGTVDGVRAGRRALTQQRRFLTRFFDRYLRREPRGSDAARVRHRKRL
jgi:pimeloyl-ACP methyl ester carboxylesterase